MMKKVLLLNALLTACTTIAIGQKDTTATTLDEVTITANKQEQKQSSTAKVVTIISRQQLEKNTGRNLAQVLNEQAGLIVNGAQNTLGTNLGVYMRGSNTANTLILVDGVPANDPSVTEGFFDLNYFSIDQIERVEILKGSQSVLYGSDAVAGVINIITRKGITTKALRANVILTGGSYNTYKASAGVEGKQKWLSYSVNYSHLQSKGFSAALDNTDKANFDKDGYRQEVVTANLMLTPIAALKCRLYSQYSYNKADIDDGQFIDDKNNTIANKDFQSGLASTYQTGKGTINLNININNTNRQANDEINIPPGSNDYDPSFAHYKGKTWFVELYTNQQISKYINILVGRDFRNQEADIESSYGQLGHDSLQSTQASYYASIALQTWHNLSAELGGRYTLHSTFGSAYTYSFNPSYLINKQIKLFANISSAYRAPSVYQLGSEYGNKNLQPEKTNSWEGGLQYTNNANTINARATYFNRNTSNVIIFKTLPSPPYGQYNNADKQKDHGMEFEAKAKLSSQFLITTNYTFVTGEISTNNAGTGKDTSFYNVIRRPKNSFNMGANFTPNEKWFASLNCRWVGKRKDIYFDPNTYSAISETLSDYYNIDAYISYKPNKQLTFFSDFRNVTNKKYFDLYGYNSRRFNMMVGIMATF